MRVVKHRLCEMLPDVCVFLDADELDEVDQFEQHIDTSECVLVFCTGAFCDSRDCMRQLRHAVAREIPLIALIEDGEHGGDADAFKAALAATDEKCEQWGFEGGPSGAELSTALFERELIEWSRLVAFQDVSMWLVAERLLPAEHAPLMRPGEHLALSNRFAGKGAEAAETDQWESLMDLTAEEGAKAAQLELWLASSVMYSLTLMKRCALYVWSVFRRTFFKPSERLVDGSPSSSDQQQARRLKLPSSKPAQIAAAERLFVSPNNEGAMELAGEAELQAVVQEVGELATCQRFLLYLDARTWTGGARSEALAEEVAQAMRAGIKMIIAHEVPGVSQSSHAVGFDSFYACPEGATPTRLLQAGVYSQAVVPLKAGPWRLASLALLARELAKPLETPAHLPADEPSTSSPATHAGSSDAPSLAPSSMKKPRALSVAGRCARGRAQSIANPRGIARNSIVPAGQQQVTNRI